MSKAKKYIIIGLVGASCFTLFLFYYFGQIPFVPSPFDTPPINQQEFDVYNITIIINYDGVKPEKKVENLNLTNYETSVFNALLNCSIVDYISYPNGAVYITGIDNVKNNIDLTNHFWLYYVNRDQPSVGCSHYNLQNNTIVTWNYTNLGV